MCLAGGLGLTVCRPPYHRHMAISLHARPCFSCFPFIPASLSREGRSLSMFPFAPPAFPAPSQLCRSPLSPLIPRPLPYYTQRPPPHSHCDSHEATPPIAAAAAFFTCRFHVLLPALPCKPSLPPRPPSRCVHQHSVVRVTPCLISAKYPV